MTEFCEDTKTYPENKCNKIWDFSFLSGNYGQKPKLGPTCANYPVFQVQKSARSWSQPPPYRFFKQYQTKKQCCRHTADSNWGKARRKAQTWERHVFQATIASPPLRGQLFLPANKGRRGVGEAQKESPVKTMRVCSKEKQAFYSWIACCALAFALMLC